MIALPRRYWVLLCAVTGVALSIVLNPAIVQPDWLYDPVGDGILIAEGLLGIAWCVAACVLRLRAGPATQAPLTDVLGHEAAPGKTQHAVPDTHHSPRTAAADAPNPSRRVHQFAAESCLLLCITGLWLAMFWDRVRDPILSVDDFDYVRRSKDWATTRENLFTPYNEHLCVPTRLLTWVVSDLVEPAHLPRGLAWAGMALFAASFAPLYVFVRREFGAPTLGLLGVSLFALTTVHREVVTWYSATQWCWALLLLLGALLVLQASGSDPPWWRTLVVTGLAAIGPLCYAVGLWVGPIATVYMTARRRALGLPCSLAKIASPLAGTVLSLMLIVPLKAQEILASADYGGRPPAEAISLLDGALFGVRSTVDLLVLRNLGVEPSGLSLRVVYAVLFPLIVFGVSELVQRGSAATASFLGVALVLLPYTMTLPFRAWVRYETYMTWTRYQLFPQLGVVLLVLAALVSFGPSWIRATRLSGRHVLLVLGLAATQFLLHHTG